MVCVFTWKSFAGVTFFFLNLNCNSSRIHLRIGRYYFLINEFAFDAVGFKMSQIYDKNLTTG